jgi:signal transduction histidine kinase
LTIADNGRGFDATQSGSGHGLANMRRRARALGGTIDLASTAGGGTRVTLQAPMLAPWRHGVLLRRVWKADPT